MKEKDTLEQLAQSLNVLQVYGAALFKPPKVKADLTLSQNKSSH